MSKGYGRVYKVTLLLPDGTKEYFYGSLKAIVDELGEERLGCSVGTLYRAKMSPGKHYGNGRCTITCQELRRSAHRNGVETHE